MKVRLELSMYTLALCHLSRHESGKTVNRLSHVTLAFSQRPLLIVIKVGVSANSRPRSKGVSQEAIFAIKGVAVSMLC